MPDTGNESLDTQTVTGAKPGVNRPKRPATFEKLVSFFRYQKSDNHPVNEYFAEYCSFVWSELKVVDQTITPEEVGLTEALIEDGAPETVVRIESLLIDRMPRERLVYYYVHVLDRFRAIHPNEPPKFWDQNALGKPNILPDFELRSYTKECLRELYREFLSQRAKEMSLAKHVRETALIAGFVFFFTIAFIIFIQNISNNQLSIPPLVLILMTGFIAGIVGHIRELLTPSKKKDGYLTMYQLRSLYLQWPYKAVVGMLYSLFFTLICLSGLPDLIGFNLFPKLNPVWIERSSAQVLTGVGLPGFFFAPPDDTEYAKLLVWCFICGFAQPFIPGVIDRLISADPKKAKPE